MNIFSPASDAAARIARLAWFMVILAAIIYAIVILAGLIAIRRHRDRAPDSVDMSDPGVRWILISGILLPALVLGAIFVVAETALGRYPDPRPALTVRVLAHQWWWEFEYVLPQLHERFRTANELHIPVGHAVRLEMTSADVIHSFWVPRLQGKMDVIPGDTNVLRLTANTAGEYRGVCQEYCGAQHANMGIVVVADDSATFAKWLRTQMNDAQAPTDSTRLLGQQLFVTGPCALCHTVRGTEARGQVAPDLTHIGSRSTLAAGTIPNSIGNLEAWSTNAQSIKPGTKMPQVTQLEGRELRALAAYLWGLK